MDQNEMKISHLSDDDSLSEGNEEVEQPKKLTFPLIRQHSDDKFINKRRALDLSEASSEEAEEVRDSEERFHVDHSYVVSLPPERDNQSPENEEPNSDGEDGPMIQGEAFPTPTLSSEYQGGGPEHYEDDEEEGVDVGEEEKYPEESDVEDDGLIPSTAERDNQSSHEDEEHDEDDDRGFQIQGESFLPYEDEEDDISENGEEIVANAEYDMEIAEVQSGEPASHTAYEEEEEVCEYEQDEGESGEDHFDINEETKEPDVLTSYAERDNQSSDEDEESITTPTLSSVYQVGEPEYEDYEAEKEDVELDEDEQKYPEETYEENMIPSPAERENQYSDEGEDSNYFNNLYEDGDDGQGESFLTPTLSFEYQGGEPGFPMENDDNGDEENEVSPEAEFEVEDDGEDEEGEREDYNGEVLYELAYSITGNSDHVEEVESDHSSDSSEYYRPRGDLNPELSCNNYADETSSECLDEEMAEDDSEIEEVDNDETESNEELELDDDPEMDDDLDNDEVDNDDDNATDNTNNDDD